MDLSQDPSPAHTIPLQAGEQVVINGALVTATGPCELQVSPGAYLFTGRDREPRADTLQSAHSTLYFGLLAAYADPERFDTARYSLFEMLGEVVMEERQAKAQ